MLQAVEVELPARAYDPEHQLTLLARRLTGQVVDPCEGISFQASADEQEFREAAIGQLEVHPFLTEGASDVFGSMVAAAAVDRGESLAGAEVKAGRYSQWPFMWRFFSERVADRTPTVEAESLGWVLASLWTAIDDPGWTTLDQDEEADQLSCRISQPDWDIQLHVIGDVVLRGIARNLEVELPQGVLKLGVRARDSDAAVFVLDGVCSFRAQELLVDVPELLLEPSAVVSLDVRHCDSPLKRVRRLPRAQLKVAKSIFRHPWSQIAQLLEPTTALEGEDALNAFLQDVARALPRGGRPAFLDGSGRPLEDDQNFLGWPSSYRQALGALLRQLRDLDCVTTSRHQAHGPIPTFSYRPAGFTWGDLSDGLPSTEPWASVDWSRVTRYLEG